MEQVLERSNNERLDMAAAAVSKALESANETHGFFGGYAVTLLGGARTTQDVDVIVGDDAQRIRDILLAADEGFSITQGNKLTFKVPAAPGISGHEVTVELLRGGANVQLKLPDANNVPLIRINPSEVDNSRLDCEVSIIHPAVLVLTKVKRWMYIAESTRPKSVTKADNDMVDIVTILKWLKKHSMVVDFSKYPEKPKGDLLPGLRMLMHCRNPDPEIYDLLESTLSPEDFQAIQ